MSTNTNKYIYIPLLMQIKLTFLILVFSLSLSANSDLQKVSLQQNWKHQFQFAGYYMAKEKGFYKDVGIDLNLKEFKNGSIVSDDVVSGKSDFGIGRSSLIIDKIKRKKEILLLAAIYQSSPLILISLKSSAIKTISDIRGKSLQGSPDKASMASIDAMLLSNGIKKNDYKRTEPTFNYDALINHETDLMTAYISDKPFGLKNKGYETTIFNPKDYGFDFYDDILFTSNEFEQKNHELVKNFYNASLKGWKYAFDNIDETIEVICNKYNARNFSKEDLLYEANKLKELALVNNIPLGNIKGEKLQSIANTYFLLGLMDSNL